MSRTQEFLDFLDQLMEAAPDVAQTMSDNVKAYIETLKGKHEEKPLFTDNGKLILRYMQEHQDEEMWKAKDIGEGLFISSRTVSGGIRKLCTDGYVEKVGQNPVVYTLTDLGKNIVIEN